MLDAAPGMLGLETAMSLTLTELQCTPQRLFALLSSGPARVARITDTHGLLAEGRVAHITVVDPTQRWTVDPGQLASKARNTPFAGRAMTGRARHTVCAGIVTVMNAEAQR